MKSSVFISLIKACQNKNGNFCLFNRYCAKDPIKFFKSKNLIDEYNSLTGEEQEIFRDDNKFFDLLSKYGFKTEENVVKNLYPRCKICGTKTEFINIQSGYKNTCSDECAKLLSQKSCIEKYGCKNPSQSPLVKEKKKETCLKNFGVEHPNKSNIVKEKIKKTCKEKYGKECSLQVKEIRDKAKQTCMEKYGYENATQSSLIQEKIKQTNVKRYGVEYVFQAESVREKQKQTCMERYGYESALQSPFIQEKMKQTCMEKYGVEYVAQVKEIREKQKQTCKEKYGTEYAFQAEPVKEKIKQTNVERYGTEYPAQKHFKNLDKLSVEFIKENFVEGKKFDIYKIKEFFNIKGSAKSAVINEIILSLKEEGYRQRTVFVAEDNFLDEIETSLNTTLTRQYRIPNTIFKSDGYDPKTNTIYEFLGDYWHGNPKLYDFDKVNLNNGVSFKELNQKTFERFDEIKKLGYNIKYIWENDYNKNGLDALVDY